LERIAVERFFDESGGMQVVIHSPWGSRINRAWGLALRKRFCRRFDFELQASATDDGINLSLGPQQSFPLEDLAGFLRAAQAEETLVQAVLASPLFTTRWRWTLTRSLILPRFSRGRRIPPALQRMRAEDLLAAVFPAQVQCQDNRPGEDVAVPDHPLVYETLRDCLTEALDLPSLQEVLKGVENGTVDIVARDTPVPSAFSHQILNAMPYAFLDDAPLEERRARAVFLRRVLPENAAELGSLDPKAIHDVSSEAWPAIRDEEELHDALLGMVLYPESLIERLPADSLAWLVRLEQAGRARRVNLCDRTHWIAAESAGWLQAEDGSPAPSQRLVESVVRGWAEVSGPVTAGGIAQWSGFEPESIRAALLTMEAEGVLLRGRFTGAPAEEEFCDRRILARIHRATIGRLRREIEPVTPAAFIRFLVSWQHAGPDSRLEDEAGLVAVLEQLQGFETAAAAWEEEILPARIRDYDLEMLDRLCLMGDVAWGRWTHRDTQAGVPAHRPGLTRTAALGIGMRADLPWLLDGLPADEAALSAPARDVLAFLRNRGASFFPEMVAGTRHLPSEVEEALWQLVAAGLVTADAFEGLRALVSGDARRQERAPRGRRKPRRTRVGRWSLLTMPEARPEDRADFLARQYLRRYGVLLRELLVRESSSPPWRELLRVLRRMEARGEIRGGRFVAGCVGEQFALPEAVDALRAERRRDAAGEFARIAACDPLNLAGILTPGPRVPSVLGNRVVYRDGAPVASLESGGIRWIAELEPPERRAVEKMLDPRPSPSFQVVNASA
jgi:ATP-dependent Lhr-like helicase